MRMPSISYGGKACRRSALSSALLPIVALVLASPTLAPRAFAAPGEAPAAGHPVRQVYFGDTHLHTSYSFDAFLNGNRSADPDTAYRWAKGLPVIHPYHRARVRIQTPQVEGSSGRLGNSE